jgi:4-amino-4-deoxy-L-arabinose transferase-like glycosyltransferase
LSLNDKYLAPLLDARAYYDWAHNIFSQNNFLGEGPFLLNPGYPYLLAGLFYLFGAKVSLITFIQFFVGALASVLVYFIASDVFNKKVGFLAGVLSAVYGVHIFYEGVLVNFVWINFINLLVILLLLKLHKNRLNIISLIAGLLIGLSALFRPNILLFIPLLLAWFVVFFRKGSLKPLLCLSAGALIFLLPVLVRNVVVINEPVISSVSSGINLYIGNSPESDGTNMAIFKMGDVNLAAEPSAMLSFFKKKAEKNFSRSITYREMNDFWRNRSLLFILKRPLEWVKLEVKKIMLFFNFREASSNYNYDLFKAKYLIFKILPDASFVIPLFLLGLCYIFFPRVFNIYSINDSFWIESHKVALLLLYLMVYLLTVLLFFMLAEYRLPAISIMIIFASYAIITIAKFFKKPGRNIMISALLMLIVIKIGSYRPPLNAVQLCDMATYYRRINNIEAARQFNLRAIVKDSEYYLPYYQMGTLLYVDEHVNLDAAVYLKKSIELLPTSAAYINLGNIYQKEEKYIKSQKAYIEAIKLAPNIPEGWNNLAATEVMLGNYRRAISAWRQYLSLIQNKQEKDIITTNIKLLKGKLAKL